MDIATATWLQQNCAGADYAGNMFLPRELLIFSQEKQWRKGGEEELIHFWIFLFPKMMSFQLYICNKCTARIVTLEKAFIDLSDFKKSARACMEQGHHSLKRTKATTGEVGMSPNTFRERPRSKVARRLRFTSK